MGSAQPPDTSEALIGAVAAYHASRGSNPALAITCRDRVDGAGAQSLAIASALLWAEATGCRYLHTPFVRMAHAIGDRRSWAAQWEAFLNLGQGESPVPADARMISLDEFLVDPLGCIGPETVLAASQFHCLKFQIPSALQNLRTRLRVKYNAVDKSHLALPRKSRDILVVAVHVRRGDVTADHPQRRYSYTRDEPILRTIASIRAAAQAVGRAVRVYVFSEGRPDGFASFAAAGCRVRLSKDTFQTFHRLVNADILVQAKSSFSYMAGLFSTGIVLHERYPDFWGRPFYAPAPGWIVRDDDGAFVMAELQDRIGPPTHGPLQRLRRWILPT